MSMFASYTQGEMPADWRTEVAAQLREGWYEQQDGWRWVLAARFNGKINLSSVVPTLDEARMAKARWSGFECYLASRDELGVLGPEHFESGDPADDLVRGAGDGQ